MQTSYCSPLSDWNPHHSPKRRPEEQFFPTFRRARILHHPPNTHTILTTNHPKDFEACTVLQQFFPHRGKQIRIRNGDWQHEVAPRGAFWQRKQGSRPAGGGPGWGGGRAGGLEPGMSSAGGLQRLHKKAAVRQTTRFGFPPLPASPSQIGDPAHRRLRYRPSF